MSYLSTRNISRVFLFVYKSFVKCANIVTLHNKQYMEYMGNKNFKQIGVNLMVYNPTEAAAVLGLHKATVLRYIKKGEIRASKFGKKIKIDETDLEAFKESHTTGASK